MKENKLQIKFFAWKKLITGFLMLGLMVVFTQCYKDKGNYDYTQLDSIVIDTTGIHAAHAVAQFGTLNIAPKVLFKGVEVNDNNSSFEFSWIIYPSGSTIGTGVSDSRRDTLANTIVLNAVMTQPTTVNWTLLFTATHRETGLREFVKFSVVIDGAFADGWVVLYERDGNTDVGLISNDWNRSTPDVPNVYFTDILLSVGGARLSGKPVSIAHPLGSLTKDLIIASENDMIGVDRQTFLTTRVFEDLFAPGLVPTERKISWFGNASTARETVINNNQVHYAAFTGMAGMGGTNRDNIKFANSMVGNYGVLAPWTARVNAGSLEAIVYDQTNKRFLGIVGNGFELRRFADQTGVVEFDVNNVGMEMLFSSFGRGQGVAASGWEYSIMKDGSDYALLVSNFHTANINITNIGMYKRNMTNAPNIADITSIAPGFNTPFIYYSCKAKVHMFWWDNDAVPFREAWTAPAGEEITAVRLQTHPNLTSPMANRWEVIYIATWNGSEGTVYSYKVDPNTGVIDTSELRKYTGFGKIKEIAWKSPN